MPPRKKALTSLPQKATPAPVKPTAKIKQSSILNPEETAPALKLIEGGKKFTKVDLVRTAMQLQQQHINPTVNGFGAPIETKPKSIVAYQLTFDDGTVLYAEGRHADVIARFIDECQAICLGQGQAAYNGPPMTKYTKEQWAIKNAPVAL